jgi:hypothetical protein
MDSGSGIRGLGSGMKKFSNPDSWSGTICTIWKPANGIEKRSKFKPSYWSTGTGIGKHSVAERESHGFASFSLLEPELEPHQYIQISEFCTIQYVLTIGKWIGAGTASFLRPRAAINYAAPQKLSTRHVPGSYHLIKGAGQSSAHPAIRAAAQAVLISVAVGLQQLDDVLLPGRRCCCHHYT